MEPDERLHLLANSGREASSACYQHLTRAPLAMPPVRDADGHVSGAEPDGDMAEQEHQADDRDDRDDERAAPATLPLIKHLMMLAA